MRKPGKRLGCILLGLALQIPALLPLIGAVLDMHNRFSITASILFPYAAISDRLRQPPLFLILVVLAVSAPVPDLRRHHRPGMDEEPAWASNPRSRVGAWNRRRRRSVHEDGKGVLIVLSILFPANGAS